MPKPLALRARPRTRGVKKRADKRNESLLTLAAFLATLGLPLGPVNEARAETAISIKLDSCRKLIADNASIYDWSEWEDDIWAHPMLARSLFPELTFERLDADEMDYGPNNAWEIITECRKLRKAK